MGGSDENQPAVIRPQNIQGVLDLGVGKFPMGMNQNRRALSTINHNIIGTNKRPALSENNGVSCKIPPIPAHRPVTRKFAQQMATTQKQPQLPEEKKKSEDSIIVDVDEYKCVGDSPVPMFVQHTEAMLDEIDRMEVEMEDASATAEKVRDIDSGDQNNHLAVVDYVDEIYAYYKKVESLSCISIDYVSQQSDINDRMRAILVDWLIEVHYKFELMEETLYLTVNLIDRFLAVEPVVRKKLQLVGVTAMLLACKYEEVSVPVVDDLIHISDKAYCRKEVLDMEKVMLNRLQFNMSVPTPYVFMRRFLKAAQSDKKVELLSFYMIELSLVEYEMIKFPPSLLAAAAVFTAQCALNGYQHWSRTSQKYASYSTNELRECSKMMVIIHQKAPTGKLNGVYRKYSTSKYGYVAKYEPAYFLLDDKF